MVRKCNWPQQYQSYKKMYHKWDTYLNMKCNRYNEIGHIVIKYMNEKINLVKKILEDRFKVELLYILKKPIIFTKLIIY